MPPTALLKDPACSGVLEKRGTGPFNQSWRSRFCVLHQRVLYWLKDPADKEPAGLVNLAEPELRVDRIDAVTCEVRTAKKTYVFRAPSEAHMSEWLDAFGVAGAAVHDTHSSTADVSSTRSHQSSFASGSMSAAASAAAVAAASSNGGNSTNSTSNSSSGSSSNSSSGNGGGGGSLSFASALDRALIARDPHNEELIRLLRAGARFSKFKHKKGQERLIWAPFELDRMCWGADKKAIKGAIMVREILRVTDGCAGSKRPELAFTIVTQDRTLELEAPTAKDKTDWVNAVNMLIAFHK